MISIEHLQELERETIPKLLESGDFHSFKIEYETPFVHRMWLQLDNDTRLFLHKILPCERPYMHPHPWASVMHVIYGGSRTGLYEMVMGYGDPMKPEPEAEIMRVIMSGGYYEMLHPNGWHSVKPLNLPVYTLMITERRDWPVLNDKKPEGPKEQLSFQQQKELIGFFKYHYDDRPF
jgi:hypothetical protein